MAGGGTTCSKRLTLVLARLLSAGDVAAEAVGSSGMAYDEALADRIRAALRDQDGLTEMRMFGGLAFLVNGNMAVGASGQGGLLLRVDPAGTDSLVREDGVTRFEMRGREMNGWVRVDPTAIASEEELSRWVQVGVGCAAGLPAK